jgi:hypothetical protein
VHPTLVDNRQLVGFPSVDDGWEFFPELNQWATDHLPLRGQAVQANTSLSQAVFDELPATAGTPSVVEGKDGWLFYRQDLDHACDYRAVEPQLGDQFVRLAGVADQLHVPFISTVGPDKTTVETDHLPPTYPRMACSREAKAATWAMLAAQPPPGFINLLPALTATKAEHGAAYKPQDTHFNDWGNVAYARALVTAVDPSAWDTAQIVQTGPHSTMGDLNAFAGKPGPTWFDGVEVHRPGVTVTQQEFATVGGVTVDVRTTATSTGAPLIPGRTVIIGDSFTDQALPSIAPFFQEIDLIQRHSIPAPTNMAAVLATADRIVSEVVERDFVTDATTELSPAYIAAVRSALAARSS